MLSQPFSQWWCCLNPRERNTISLLVPFYVTNDEYITQSNFTIIAIITGLASSILMDEYFLMHYGLTSGLIFPEDAPPISVFFFDSELWAQIFIFSTTDAFICTARCAILTFPN